VTLAYKSGASAIRFFAEEYGPDFPGKLLKAMRDRFDVSILASELTHKDFRALDSQWREHIRAHYTAQAARLALKEPESFGARLTAPPSLPAFDESPALSPDGERLAFMTDRRGPPEVAVINLKTGAVRFLAGRPSDRIEYVHAEQHALSFSADGHWLAFVGEKEQRDYLYLYDLKRDRLRRIRTPFEQIRSPVFHPSESSG
jgi:dipeptidyl aminopeptidase/acylaminoacyl peptidase